MSEQKKKKKHTQYRFMYKIEERHKWSEAIEAGKATDIRELGLSVLTTQALDGIYAIEQLTEITEKELMRMDGMGIKRFFEVKDALAERGLSLSPTSQGVGYYRGRESDGEFRNYDYDPEHIYE